LRTLAWIAVGVALAIVAPAGCSSGCANRVTNRVSSPDGARDAVVFTRDCGAGTTGSVQVEIVASGAVPEDKPSSLFIIDHPVDTPGRVDARWASSARLVVTYPPGARVVKQEASRGDVSIVYSATP